MIVIVERGDQRCGVTKAHLDAAHLEGDVRIERQAEEFMVGAKTETIKIPVLENAAVQFFRVFNVIVPFTLRANEAQAEKRPANKESAFTNLLRLQVCGL